MCDGKCAGCLSLIHYNVYYAPRMRLELKSNGVHLVGKPVSEAFDDLFTRMGTIACTGSPQTIKLGKTMPDALRYELVSRGYSVRTLGDVVGADLYISWE